jgi:S1-C subfamily serine protease
VIRAGELLRLVACSIVLVACLTCGAQAQLPETIERVKPSIVAVGLFKQATSPPFTFRGTGFVVGSGNLIATNAHVIPESLGTDGMTTLMIRASVPPAPAQFRPARLVALDRDHDLALLRVGDAPLPALAVRGTDAFREGQSIAFTGFPIAGALGFSPVTHRGMISAITPIVLPSATGQQLSEKSIRRIRSGSFDILQLDATAYPGSSGSPVYDPENGEVIAVINMVFVKSTKENVLSQPSGITYAIPATYLRELLRTAN